LRRLRLGEERKKEEEEETTGQKYNVRIGHNQRENCRFSLWNRCDTFYSSVNISTSGLHAAAILKTTLYDIECTC